MASGVAQATQQTNLGQRRAGQSEHGEPSWPGKHHRMEGWRNLGGQHPHRSPWSVDYLPDMDHAGPAGWSDHSPSWLWSPPWGALGERNWVRRIPGENLRHSMG